MQKDKEADVISTLTKLYVDTVDNSLKILSVNSSELTKAEIQSLIPGITIYRIDQPRQQLNTSSERERGLHVREKVKVPRRRGWMKTNYNMPLVSFLIHHLCSWCSMVQEI